MISWFCELWARRPWSTAYVVFCLGGIFTTALAQWAGVL